MHAGLVAVLAAVVACMTPVTPALADPNGAIGQVQLAPSKAFPKFTGRAEIVVLSYDAEVQVGFEGTPRRRDSWLLLWLDGGGKKVWLGGAVPAATPPRGISAVIPGRRPVAKRHARAAKRLVVTLVSERRVIEISARGKRSGWRKPMRIQGTRVAQGPVVPCPSGECPLPPPPVV